MQNDFYKTSALAFLDLVAMNIHILVFYCLIINQTKIVLDVVAMNIHILVFYCIIINQTKIVNPHTPYMDILLS